MRCSDVQAVTKLRRKSKPLGIGKGYCYVIITCNILSMKGVIKMGLKQYVKGFITRYRPLRKLYVLMRSSQLNNELTHKYANMTRKDIFSSIYSNFTWGGVYYELLLRNRLSR